MLITHNRISTQIDCTPLNWLFVESVEKNSKSKQYDVESFRRSLAGFLVNMIEIWLYFSIVYLLLVPDLDVWATVVKSFKAVFTFNLMFDINDISFKSGFAVLQIVISWFLYAVILANVIGSIKRKEKAP